MCDKFDFLRNIYWRFSYYLILVLSFSIQVVVLQSTSNGVLFSEIVMVV